MFDEALALWTQATLVARLVLLLLLVMSLCSWAIMLAKWRELRLARNDMRRGIRVLLADKDLHDAMSSLTRPETPLSRRMSALGTREYERLARRGDLERLLADNMRRMLRHGVAEEMRGLSRFLPLLATTANTAPFIGLFGTVWGIIHAFHSIGHQKSAALATVAPGISEALIATAVGLAVAIPATAGYNVFCGMLAAIEGQCVSFAGLFLNRLRQEAPHEAPLPGGEG
ncbi:MAG: MotA/TolQ/ExbB proton channel family protein [Thermodesulfobacteriota bacterium]